ncbi:glutamine--fructose-6-phosphate transaminase (isomerizing) [Rhodothermus marinus]|uniref:glutamine--fructose-6-phosphate transaminase (isomerizing) n=1 Tax=Rhodothermus marinus TaxID=29549 RepID=UPI0012BA3C30|nr:glutamine--fructose-6-phosphate transaminase (isomerizing) [Rhodothermus marinus]BBM68779.1 glutamine--fructose-6-phosphate aminotransferase [isomerizing] [Rhodothermus marinus]BBM71758.1 glutamine--fructose-6-phosphate aminotransferase [isomerizing] [Rhodothermus marinus]
MCGIVGYIGHRPAAELLLNGLKRLEYRGYDSAGIAVVGDGRLQVHKQKGKVDELAAALRERLPEGTLGIGHTRWATHGEPNDVNAHPHVSSDGDFALVHNGIIENYAALRKRLQQKGYVFRSETDTEALVHLIDDVRRATGLPLPEAVRQALTQVVGTYGLAIVSASDPDLLIAARKGSPLILGIGEGEYFLASDAAPIVEHTRQVVYLNDGEVVIVRRSGYEVRTIDNVLLEKEVHELEWDLEQIEKGGYPHFMLKEIMEQPEALENCLRGRLDLQHNTVKLGGLIDVMDRIRAADRIIICACGTSWHAGLVGEYLIEEFARIPVEVEYASEFRYRNPVLRPNDVVIAISQSGETADTLAAVREAKRQGVLTLGICNVVGSTIARETDAGVYLHVGPEIGVASTKAFTAQVAVLTMLALKLAEGRTLSEAEMAQALRALAEIPDKVRQVLTLDEEIRRIAHVYRYASNFLYLGRGYNFPVALEGALKLKEISYIHAEGYPAAEMKHGPIALIDRFMPVVFIAMKDRTYDKVVSNIEEVVARQGSVIAITDEGNGELDKLCEYVIRIPPAPDFLTPLLTVIPLQLLAYHIAVMRGCNVDQPRNLAKSVTVE